MTICWERAVPLAFLLCCFNFSAVFSCTSPFPMWCLGRMWNSIVRFLIFPFLSTFITFVKGYGALELFGFFFFFFFE